MAGASRPPPQAAKRTPRQPGHAPRPPGGEAGFSKMTPVSAGGAIAGLASAPPPSATPGMPFERLLARQEHSISTFHSSLESDGGGVVHAGLRPEWSQEMPHAILFPANKPSSRADAAILDQWVTQALADYAGRADAGDMDDEGLSKAVQELVPVLSIGFHELVRQVSQHCLERGVVLERIWRTFVDMFERTLSGTRSALRRQKGKYKRVQADIRTVHQEVRDIREKHPLQLQRLTTTLESKFAQRNEDINEQLRQVQAANGQLQKHMKTVRQSALNWFPHFDAYRVNGLRQNLERMAAEIASADTPEAYLAADFSRILNSLPAENRRNVGYYISSLLGLRGARVLPDTAEALAGVRDHNAWKIEQLEARLEELRQGRGCGP